MATSTTTIKRTVTLVLTEDEADWLESILQNPVDVRTNTSLPEVSEHRRNREGIFTALKNSTIPPTAARG